MAFRQMVVGLFLGLCTYTVSHGQILTNPTQYCSYTATPLAAELYLSREGVDAVVQMVDDICADAGSRRNFVISAANVPTVAAVRYEGVFYLLYNSAYCRRTLEENPRQLYFMLAHTSGHLLSRHNFEVHFRLHQESVADEFMGRALFQANAFPSREDALGMILPLAYAYALAYRSMQDRSATISRGWNAEENLVKSEKNLGYLNSETVQGNAPLPHFELKGCPRWHEFDSSNFSYCSNLGEVDSILVAALHLLGYEQHSYFSLPKGFAILTPIEQIHKDGSSLSGAERWQDYPAGGSFAGLLDYLSSLLVPRHGYFRLFVFTVTDRPITNNQQKITASSAKAWLQSGGQWLPDVIGREPFTKSHRTNIFIYEFSAAEDTKVLKPCCNEHVLTIAQHLARSGLIRLFRP